MTYFITRVNCPECGSEIVVRQSEDNTENVPFGSCDNCQKISAYIRYDADGCLKLFVFRDIASVNTGALTNEN